MRTNKHNLCLMLLFMTISLNAMGFSLGETQLKSLAKNLNVISKEIPQPELKKGETQKMSGDEFNQYHPGLFLKLVTASENEGGLQFKDGTCTDSNSISTIDSNKNVEIDFSDIFHIQKYYKPGIYDHFRVVTIPSYAQVSINGKNEFKTSAICLSTKGKTNSQESLEADIRELLTTILLENAEKLSLLNLDAAKLQGLNLRGFNFQGLNLKNVDFSKSHLEGVHFEKANLSYATFRYASLAGAHFEQADLAFAHFWMADVDGIFLEKSKNLDTAHLDYANTSDFRFP